MYMDPFASALCTDEARQVIMRYIKHCPDQGHA